MLFKIKLTLVLLFTAFTLIAQDSTETHTVLSHSDLPAIVENDTVIIRGSAFVQTEEQEIHQQGREHKLKKKLKKTESILKEKFEKEQVIDTLLQSLSKLNMENDSLITRLETLTGDMAEECKAKIWSNAVKLDNMTMELMRLRREVRALKRKLVIHKLIIVGEAVLIVIILI